MVAELASIYSQPVRRGFDTASRLIKKLTGRVDALTPSAWTGVTFQNGWANAGVPWADVKYRKAGDIVYLRGTAASGTGTNGTAMFTLPSGFRPPATLSVPVEAASEFAWMHVASSGVVSCHQADGTAPNTSFSFNTQFATG